MKRVSPEMPSCKSLDRNNGAFKDSIPYVVLVQSSLFDHHVCGGQSTGGEQVASLVDCGLAISDALDELLTRSRG